MLLNQGTVKRRKTWNKVAKLLNAIEELQFKIKQNALEKGTHFLKNYSRKIERREKESGIRSPHLREIECAFRYIMKTSTDGSLRATPELEKGNTDEM